MRLESATRSGSIISTSTPSAAQRRCGSCEAVELVGSVADDDLAATSWATPCSAPRCDLRCRPAAQSRAVSDPAIDAGAG